MTPSVDRMGRPAINTVLIPSSLKDEFNRVAPHRQRDRFGDIVRGNIAQLNGGDTALAATLTDVLLPDLLSYEVGDSSGFLNGRRLADDVIDAELNLLTKGAVTGDGVANDSAFTTTLPVPGGGERELILAARAVAQGASGEVGGGLTASPGATGWCVVRRRWPELPRATTRSPKDPHRPRRPGRRGRCVRATTRQ